MRHVKGRSQDFSMGGHTVSNNIVMEFSPRNIEGCLLKKGLQRGITGTPGPSSYALDVNVGAFGVYVRRYKTNKQTNKHKENSKTRCDFYSLVIYDWFYVLLFFTRPV